jgi:ABC-type glycerol-3-phosphate transport system substrate-binding protein
MPDKHLYVLLLGLLVLCACAVPPTPMLPTSVLPVTQEDVVITFAGLETDRRIYAPLIDRFERENPDIHVQFVPATIDRVNLGNIEGYQANCRQLAERADTFVNYSCFLPDHEQQYLSDLRPFVETDAAFNRADYLPGVLEHATRLDGALFQLPTTASVTVLSYNKDLFASAGLPEPQPDWSWADLRQAAERLGQTPTGPTPRYGFLLGSVEGVDLAVVGELATAGIDLTSEVGQQLPQDDPRFVTALQNVVAMVRSGAIYHDPSSIINMNRLSELIQSGKVGMWDAGLLPATASQNSDTIVNIGTVPLPQLPYSPVKHGRVVAMSAGTQHPEAAWRWLSFLSRQDVRTTDMWGPGDDMELPARHSVLAQTQALEQLDPAMAEAVRLTLSRSIQRTWIPALTLQIPAVLDGKDALQAAQEIQATAVTNRTAPTAVTPTRDPMVVATPVPQPDAAVNAVSLTFGMYEPDHTDSLLSLVPQFQQAYPNLTVQVVDRSRDGVESLSEAAQQDDCFAWTSPPIMDDSSASVRDLQPLVDADPTLSLSDYPPLFLAPFQQQGQLMGLPYRFQPLVLWYNQVHFEQASLVPPDSNTTLDGMIGVAEQLTQGVGEPRRYGFATRLSSPTDINLFLTAPNAQPIRENGATLQVQFTGVPTMQALQKYVDLLRSSAPAEPLRGYARGSRPPSLTNLFLDGRVSLWFDRMGNHGMNPANVRMAPLPVDSRTIQPRRDLDGLFISAKTQQTEGCWAWLTFLSQQVATLHGALPARTSVVTSPEFQAAAAPGTTEIYAAYQPLLIGSSTQTELFPPSVDPFWFYRAVDRAVQGSDLERELQEAQTLTEAHLTCVQGGGQPGPCARQVDPTYQGFSQ